MIEKDKPINIGYATKDDGTLKILPKQIEFHSSSHRDRAYVGGVGSGKTHCGVREVIKQMCKYPNARWLIGAKTVPQLRDTTKRDFFYACDERLIRDYIKIEDRVIFINDSEVIFRHLDGVDHLKSLNLTGYYADEGSEVKEEVIMMLDSRLRWPDTRDQEGNYLKGPTDEGTPEWNATFKSIITTNPNGKDYVYRLFSRGPSRDDYKEGKEGEQEYIDAVKTFKKHTKLIVAPSTENIYLPKGYIDKLKSKGDEDWRRRYIYAEFNTFEGQIYKDFNRQVHVIHSEFKIEPHWPRIRGIDIGSDHPSACVWVAIDNDGNHYIYDEWKERNQDTEETAIAINEITGEDKISVSYIDSADPNFRKSLIKYGVTALPSIKGADSVLAGINEIKRLLRYDNKDPESKPKLFIMEHCKKIMEEFEEYRWAPIRSEISDKEMPIKRGDDLLDAFRYVIYSNLHGKTPALAKPDFGMDKRSEQEWKDTQKYLRKQKLNKIRYGTRLFKKKR